MFREIEIEQLMQKVKLLEISIANLHFTEDSEFKLRLTKLLKSEMRDTFIKLETVLVKTIS